MPFFISNQTSRTLINELRLLQEQQKTMTAELQRLTATVTKLTNADDSMIALFKGLSAQLTAAKEDPAAVQLIADNLDAEAAKVSAAVLANTPAPQPVIPPAA